MTTIAMRRSPWIASRLTSLVDTRRKKIVATAAGVNVVLVAVLALLGLWDDDSPRYWRRLAQDVVLAAADRAPANRAPGLTRTALRVHRAGVTPAEMDRAAGIFLRAGDRASAARLHLGLVRANAAAGNLPAAMAHARRADQLAPGPEALGALVVLADPGTDAGRQAVAAMQARYPRSELSQAFDCVKRVTSFAVALPASCQAYPLTRQPAAAAVADHQRIERELAGLPQKRTEQIAWYGDWEIREYAAMQRASTELKRAGFLTAILESIWRTIAGMLPQSGERLSTWFWRNLFCSTRIRWLCVLNDANLEPIVDRMEERRSLKVELASATRAWGIAMDGLDYWNSSKPHDLLVSERATLASTFRGEVYTALKARRKTVGIDRDAAIDGVLRAPRR
jgi:hypothetical protein